MGPTEFEWKVERGGHQVVPPTGELDALYLVERYQLGPGELPGQPHMRAYRPLTDHPALFREFSEVNLMVEAVQQFAGLYGFLGRGGVYIDVVREGMWTRHRVYAEPLSFWFSQIEAMKRMVRVWDLSSEEVVKEEAIEEIAAIIGLVETRASLPGEGRVWRTQRPADWGEDEDDEIPVDPYRGPIRLYGNSRVLWGHLGLLLQDHLSDDDVVKLARRWLYSGVNVRVHGAAFPAIIADTGNAKACLVHTPDSLLSAMWLQLMLAINGEKKFRRCLNCNDWFLLDPEIARTNRHYCQGACRSKAYQKRKAKAVQLHSEGLPIAEIAERLGSSERTVGGRIARGHNHTNGNKPDGRRRR